MNRRGDQHAEPHHTEGHAENSYLKRHAPCFYSRFHHPGKVTPGGKGVDVVVPGGYKYEILSGTESNLARHGRRMAGEFFRLLTF
ncbi:hypothetical protein F0U62_18775 [Cystobacter fuscus]|uniref:hypothetical protein n=1 Tax=Cystobacter fuscus TaxID=43 RepID=UPI002B2F6F51|nr:hypothetical protein F0U62_18775 [Cystobacter fuscus]